MLYESQTKTFGLAYKYIEKVQMTGFCIQEFIISGLYIWKMLDVLQAGEKKGVHRVMWQLFSINVIIILLVCQIGTQECTSRQRALFHSQ
jgi:hypothetical protein